MKNIAIFATGSGSNAQKIMEHFKDSKVAQVRLVISNKKTAGVLEKAAAYQVPTLLINREEFYKTENILEELDAHQIDYVVLAGFLWLMPSYLVKHYENQVVNIHPALLPKYGGKGMYGMNVHRAVHAAKEKESGMSIHLVNEKYDDGALLFQAKCEIEPTDTPEIIAQKVLALEHRHYPEVIEQLILGKF